jgi:branched-chain amino acid transport system substrate-binding protein
VLVACALATWPVAACSGERHAAELRVAVLATTSNETAPTSGLPTVRAARLVAKQVNDTGGVDVGGRRYRLVLLEHDIPDRAEAIAQIAQRAINQEGAVAIVGPQFSRHVLPAATVAENSHVPLVTPMSTSPAVTEGRRYVFRVAFTDDVQGRVLARFARDRLGARSAAVLYDAASEYNRVIAGVFEREFAAAGGRIVADERYTTDQSTDFAPQLRRIAAARADVLFLPNYVVPAVSQMRQARALGVRSTFLGSDSWAPYVADTVAEARGAYATHQWDTAMARAFPSARDFVRDYTAAYGQAPLSTAAATTDAVRLVVAAAHRAGRVDTEAIRDALAATRGYAGVTGTISYGATGDPRKAVVIVSLAKEGVKLVDVVGDSAPGAR